MAPGASGLDFGAGPGPVLAALLRETGYMVTLYDPFFHPETAPLEKRYDFVAASEVVEHFHHPGRDFKLLHDLLVEGGLLGLLTQLYRPEIDFGKWSYRRDPTHVVFYSERTFTWIQCRHRFTSLEFFGTQGVLLTR